MFATLLHLGSVPAVTVFAVAVVLSISAAKRKKEPWVSLLCAGTAFIFLGMASLQMSYAALHRTPGSVPESVISSLLVVADYAPVISGLIFIAGWLLALRRKNA